MIYWSLKYSELIEKLLSPGEHLSIGHKVVEIGPTDVDSLLWLERYAKIFSQQPLTLSEIPRVIDAIVILQGTVSFYHLTSELFQLFIVGKAHF